MKAYDRKIKEYRTALGDIPRVKLAHLPTPLDHCERLSLHVGGPSIWVKRDDCTGLAFGGNKARQHEYVLGAALAEGADCLIQGSASQSNHSRQLAAAGARLGLDTYILPKKDDLSHPVQGNLLVDYLLGATIVPLEPEVSIIDAKEKLARRLREEGRHPYVTGMGAGASLIQAAIAYIDALFEIVEAFPEGEMPDRIYTASQGSSQAGLLIGCELLDIDVRIIGVVPMSTEHEAYISPAGVLEIAHGAAAAIGYDSQLEIDDIHTTGAFVGEGYGIPTSEGIDAIRMLAAYEGILLDPVYSGKAFAALLDHCKNGIARPTDSVVFLHTGGTPALFAYADQLSRSVLNED